MADPLDKLLATTEEVSREMLADLLERWIRIDPETGAVVPMHGWHTLKARPRIFLFLLGRKAASLKGFLEKEGAPPKTIAESTGLPKGTVNPLLRQLTDERLLAQDKEGAYFVPPYAIGQVKGLVPEGDNVG